MAHVQQLFDHMNAKFKEIYMEGVWIKTYLTKIGKNSKGVIFFECIDAKKHNQKEPSARIILRLMDSQMGSYLNMISSIGLSADFESNISFPAGDIYISFKVLPSIHYKSGLMPIVRDINTSDHKVSSNNLRSGLRIGIDNSQLGKPENHNKPWSEEDKQFIFDFTVNRRLSVESIAMILKRTPISCVERIEMMSLVDKKQISFMRKEALRLQRLSEG